MKKIIVGIFSFVLLFVAQNAFAATWNGASNDCRGISIVNATTNEGYAYPCWPSSSVSADAGDTLNIRVYYHNTGTATANNTRVVLSAPTGSASTSKSFSGNISSDQGSLSLSTVTANLSSSQTITFNSVKWYTNNTSETLTALPGGQSGAEILSGGLNLGSIAPGWATQGSLVVSFHVSNTTAPQTCQDSNANNFGSVGACTYTQIVKCTDTSANNYNQVGTCTYTQTPQYPSYTVKLTVVGSGRITTVNSPNINSVATYQYPISSDYFGFVPSTGYHVESATLDGGTISTGGYAMYNINANHEIRVTFVADQVITKSCIATLSASRTTITAGESSLLSWTLADCTNATLYPTIGAIYSSSSQNVYPTSSMLYTLTASGANGTVTKTVMINVTPVVSTYTITATAGTGGTISPAGITSYTYPNNSKFYAVTANSGYTTREILVDGVSQPLVGGYAFYNISANHTISASFTFTQVAKSCAATLYASNISITKGESSTLTWTLTDCTNATLYPTIGAIYSSGSQNVYPTSSMLYTLTAYSSNGASVTRTVTINVNTPPVTCQDSKANNIGSPLPCTFPQVCQDYNANNYGITGTCTYTKVENTILSVISSNTSTNTNNSVNNSNNNNSVNNSNNTTNTTNTTTNTTQTPAQQICQDHSANNYLSSGSCTYTNYNRTRCLDTSATNYLDYNSCIYNQIRCLDTSASNYLEYNSCIYNQIKCLDTSATNYLAYNACVYNTYVNKNVVTTVATNITRNEAQINGYITNTTYYNANVYFNYGTTINLGSRTTSKTASGSSSFSDFLTGLSPNTIYFFQAVGENNTGISKGNIEVFKTLGNAVVTPIIVQGTTIIGKASPVLLNISNKYQLISAGDLVDYIVTYKNIGNTRLIRPMVQVVIPMNMTLINSSRGTYSVDTHTLSAPVEDLNPGQEGIIYLQARVDSIPLNNSQIVTTALLVYTNTNGAQENAMAYVFNEPSAGSGYVAGDASVLGASAFFGGFLSIGLIGWLLILLLVLIVILISRSYSKNNTSSESKTVTHTTTLQ